MSIEFKKERGEEDAANNSSSLPRKQRLNVLHKKQPSLPGKKQRLNVLHKEQPSLPGKKQRLNVLHKKQPSLPGKEQLPAQEAAPQRAPQEAALSTR